MDDPRLQQFFVDPQLTQQRHYEAIRAVLIDGQSAQTVAPRFGFTYGTLRNFLAQFRACIRQGRTPPFSPMLRADGPPPVVPSRAPIGPPAPIADCSPWTNLVRCARAWPDSFCFCPCSRNSASIVSFVKPPIPAPT